MYAEYAGVVICISLSCHPYASQLFFFVSRRLLSRAPCIFPQNQTSNFSCHPPARQGAANPGEKVRMLVRGVRHMPSAEMRYVDCTRLVQCTRGSERGRTWGAVCCLWGSGVTPRVLGHWRDATERPGEHQREPYPPTLFPRIPESQQRRVRWHSCPPAMSQPGLV